MRLLRNAATEAKFFYRRKQFFTARRGTIGHCFYFEPGAGRASLSFMFLNHSAGGFRL